MSKPAIEEIMDEFDFQNVQNVMEFLGWTWVTTGGRVPSVEQLKACARHQLEIALAKKASHSTGGFEANYREFVDKGIILTLSFILEESEAYFQL